MNKIKQGFIICFLFLITITSIGCGKDKTFIVSFDSANSTNISKVEVKEGEIVTKITDPMKEGYRFLGWYQGEEKFDFSNSIKKDVTLVAKWEKIDVTENKKFTITFNSDGGSSVISQTVEEGKTGVKPVDPTKSGYTFMGWKLGATTYDFDTTVTKDINLIASWEKTASTSGNTGSTDGPNNPTVTPVKYTVSFNSNGGNTIASLSVEKGKPVSKPANPTKAGYTFEGWYHGSTLYNFGSGVTSNLTLTAKWSLHLTTDQKNMNSAKNELGNFNIETANPTLKTSLVGGSCTVTYTGADFSKITRGVTAITKQVTAHITCGKETSDKTLTATIMASPYTYTGTVHSNMASVMVRVYQTGKEAINYKLYDANMTFLANYGVKNDGAYAKVDINRYQAGSIYYAVFNNDLNTTYALKQN